MYIPTAFESICKGTSCLRHTNRLITKNWVQISPQGTTLLYKSWIFVRALPLILVPGLLGDRKLSPKTSCDLLRTDFTPASQVKLPSPHLLSPHNWVWPAEVNNTSGSVRACPRRAGFCKRTWGHRFESMESSSSILGVPAARQIVSKMNKTEREKDEMVVKLERSCNKLDHSKRGALTINEYWNICRVQNGINVSKDEVISDHLRVNASTNAC